jgi:ABC-type branched-subunit amino acid transport system ATPase component
MAPTIDQAKMLPFDHRLHLAAQLPVNTSGGHLSDADAPIGQVPHGLRKLIEVARACAAKPVLLLLDETVAGLNDAERQSFRNVIRALHAKGLVIIIIEHDVEFIMDLCDEICVLNFGRKIADGTPGQIRKDPVVREAYLGQ